MLKFINYIIKSLLYGVISLYLINMGGQFIGINIPINLFTVMLVGIFKIPGLAFILIIMLI